VRAHLRAVVAHRDQHRYPVGFGPVDLGQVAGAQFAGARLGEQAGVDPVGELFFVEGGGERGLDLAAGVLAEASVATQRRDTTSSTATATRAGLCCIDGGRSASGRLVG
jgi:hypothetical protein